MTQSSTNKQKPVLFSGIQPTGCLNIGHYLGAIQHWLTLEDDYDCLFALVDLHAVTTIKQNSLELRQHCYQLIALYLACGLDPKRSILFAQSHVAGHTQLAWILNCITHMGELNRMTQFKDKSQQSSQNNNVGLFSYPVLMAADILLYHTAVVPVGNDQKQHLELARALALRANHVWGDDTFVVPRPHIANHGARIMSLQDPNKKMSKSDPNTANYISLLDTPQQITKKISRAVTDSDSEIRYDLKQKPGVSNLLTLFSSITQQSIVDLESTYQGKGYGTFKADLAKAMIAFLTPIQDKFQYLIQDKAMLHDILHDGALRAQQRAQHCLHRLHRIIGFLV